MPYSYDYPRPLVTVDTIILRESPLQKGLEVLLIERKNDPYAGYWALPGGYLDMEEELEVAASRELAEETGLKLNRAMKTLGTYGKVGRDPRGRTITVVFGIILNQHEAKATVIGMDDASRAKWHSISEIPTLAFDHEKILSDGIKQLIKG